MPDCPCALCAACTCSTTGDCAVCGQYPPDFHPLSLSAAAAAAKSADDRPLVRAGADIPTPESFSGYAAGVGTLFDEMEADCG